MSCNQVPFHNSIPLNLLIKESNNNNDIITTEQIDQNIKACYFNIKNLKQSFNYTLQPMRTLKRSSSTSQIPQHNLINNEKRNTNKKIQIKQLNFKNNYQHTRNVSPRSISNYSSRGETSSSPSHDYINFLRRELTISTNKNEELISMYSNINKMNISLTNENQLLRTELENMKMKYEIVVKNREQSIKKYNEDISEKNEEYNKKVESYENKIMSLNKDIDNLKKTIVDYEEINKKMKNSINILTEITNLKQAQNAEINQNFQEKQNYLSKLQSKIIENESLLSTIQIENQSLKNENELLKAKLISFNEQINNKEQIISCLKSSYEFLGHSKGIFNKKKTNNGNTKQTESENKK